MDTTTYGALHPASRILALHIRLHHRIPSYGWSDIVARSWALLQLLHVSLVLWIGFLLCIRRATLRELCTYRHAFIGAMAKILAGCAFGLLHHRHNVSVFGHK
jgi:hypothetical protein